MADLPNFMPEAILETEDEPAEEQHQEQSSGLTADQLKDILAEQRQANVDALRQVLQGPQRGVPLQEDDPLAGLDLRVDVEGLPHPAGDLNGFLQGLQERQGKVFKNALAQAVTQATTRAAQTAHAVATDQSVQDRAMDMIKDAAPDLDDDVIQFAAQQVANQYRERGMDPMAALRSDVQGVSQEILDYADSRFGGREAQPLTRKANRTGGIPASRGRAPQPKNVPEDAGDMVRELKEWQATKARLY